MTWRARVQVSESSNLEPHSLLLFLDRVLRLQSKEADMVFWMWFAAFGIFALAEILTANFIFLSFAIAALAGGVVELVGGNAPIQWAAAALMSVISLRFFRPIALKYLYKKSDSKGSWIESLIGMEATALTDITDESGQIRVNSEVWTAYSAPNAQLIPAGSEVRVESVNGAILRVSPISHYQGSK